MTTKITRDNAHEQEAHRFVAFASDAGDVGYAYIFALVFTVMAVHSLVYSYWQLTHHPNKVADFSRLRG